MDLDMGNDNMPNSFGLRVLWAKSNQMDLDTEGDNMPNPFGLRISWTVCNEVKLDTKVDNMPDPCGGRIETKTATMSNVTDCAPSSQQANQ